MNAQPSTQHPLREGSASRRLISPLQFYDPLLVLLKVKLHLSDWWVITATVIPFVASMLLIDTCSDAIAFTSLQLLALSTTALIVMRTYLFLPFAMANLFNQLWENGVIGHDHAATLGSLS